MDSKIDDDPMERAISELIENICILRKTILETSVTKNNNWFKNLLYSILTCALQDFNSVLDGARKSTYLAAWGRRNLLELKTVAQYILASKQNALEFRNDFLVDIKEFYEAITLSQQETHRRLLSELQEIAQQEKNPEKRELLSIAYKKEADLGPRAEAPELEAKAVEKVMREFGIRGSTPPKRHSAMAKAVQKATEFYPVFKICSKLMHRTALSISSISEPEGLNPILPLLYREGVIDLTSIYLMISQYYEQHGINLPG